MKPFRHLWFPGLLLFASILSCSFPDIQLIFDQIFNLPHETAQVQVESVTVLPAYGTGSFTATVKYSYTDGDGIHCYVDTGQNDGEIVHTHGLQGSAGSTTETFPVDVVKPGEHTLTCTGYSGNSSASDTFTVTSIEEPPSPSSDQPLEITGTGTVTIYPTTSDQPSACTTSATLVSLTVNPDNSAVLKVKFVYPLVADCSAPPDPAEDLRTFFGTANPQAGTVIITVSSESTVQGNLNYLTGILTGSIITSVNGKPIIMITMP